MGAYSELHESKWPSRINSPGLTTRSLVFIIILLFYRFVSPDFKFEDEFLPPVVVVCGNVGFNP